MGHIGVSTGLYGIILFVFRLSIVLYNVLYVQVKQCVALNTLSFPAKMCFVVRLHIA